MFPLRTTVDLEAIAHNTRTLKQRAGNAELMCVVKADAYNHGIEHCVPVMEANGADRFGVATFGEARRVQALTDLPVLAWLWEPGEDIPARIEVAAPSLQHLRELIDASVRPTIYLTIETGMHRAGIDETHWPEAFALAAEAHEAGKIRVAGLMSHLAVADDPEDTYTDAQAAVFQRAIELARGAGLELPRNHLANSPATLTREDLHFDMVRPGVALYGLEPIAGADNGLREAMTWVGNVIAVKPIREGETVSYGRTWAAPADGWTAVVPAGYADGVQRQWQGGLEVTIGGQRYPQVGRVCMDQLVVWLGMNPHNVQAGDEAVLFGPGGRSAADTAKAVGTINYEIVCAPRGRTKREHTLPLSGSRVCDNAADTQQLGRELAATLRAGDVVILEGPLGAGKTTFTQGLADGLGVKGRVTSPTFIIARHHKSKTTGPDLVHVDAYRLGGVGELDALDLDTDLDDAVVVAEWGGGLMEQLSGSYVHVNLDRETLVADDPETEARIVTWHRGGEDEQGVG